MESKPTVAEKLRACAKGGSAMGALGDAGTVTCNIARMFNEDEYDMAEAARSVADAIEAEESEMRGFCERLEEASQDGNEVDLFGKAYVALPVDADGETVHVGDVLYKIFSSLTGPIKVAEISLGENRWYIRDDNEARYLQEFFSHKPRSVGDILRRFALDCEATGNAGPSVEKLIEEYAKLLQCKADEQEDC